VYEWTNILYTNPKTNPLIIPGDIPDILLLSHVLEKHTFITFPHKSLDHFPLFVPLELIISYFVITRHITTNSLRSIFKFKLIYPLPLLVSQSMYSIYYPIYNLRYSFCYKCDLITNPHRLRKIVSYLIYCI